MPVLWLAPMALLGLALVAVPVAIHLLVRQQSRRVEYPSLRFLRPSPLAAFRRRNLQDALLLACRLGIIVAAVLALAGPVLQTAARSSSYEARVARAVIVEPGTEPSAAAASAAGAFVSRSFSRDRLSDAIADAMRWLNDQPPARREIVIVGALRRGAVTPGDLQGVSGSTGLRFAPVATAAVARDVVVPVLRAGTDDRLVLGQRQVSLGDDRTRVAGGVETAAAADAVRIVAAPADQPLAAAALRAALGEGLRWRVSPQQVLIAWTGADEAVVQRELRGALLVRMARPEPLSSAATALIHAVEEVSAEPLRALEPVRISDEQLRAWSRPPGGVPSDAPPGDEGDRRWLWAAGLVLLGAEYALRRPRSAGAQDEPAVEERVA